MIDLEDLAAAAETADGAAPFDEATWLALRHRPETVTRIERDGGVALVIADDVTLVVHPDARGRGIGGALLAEALATRPASAPLTAWSHGHHPAAARLAQTHDFAQVRELWVMRRAMSQPLPQVAAGDVQLRTFRPGDEAELLRVNAAAFAHHAEQGALDGAGLAERMAESWFSPDGLFVAADGERLLGFHWTKQHSPTLGEVYVVGIDPQAQGGGLGKLLTLVGLHHLADLGVDETLLYVESDNAPAVAVYAGLGFTHADVDTHVMYRRG